MFVKDPTVDAAIVAHHEGRHAEALPLLMQLLARLEAGSSPAALHVVTMFLAQLMAADYPPTLAALQPLRDRQVDKFRDGDLDFSARTSRFSFIAELNDLLQDPAATCALFVHLDATAPDLARQHAHRALPALVATGNLLLAERYRPDPLRALGDCNALAENCSLFSRTRGADRLAGELMCLMGDVQIALAIFEGTGRAEEAAALRADVVKGLHDEELRALAQRDLASPGAISRALSEHDLALENVPASPCS